MSYQTITHAQITPSLWGLRMAVAAQVAAVSLWSRIHDDDRGQSTAEYALVILGAAGVALLLVAWTSKTNKIGKLLDTVMDAVLSRFV